MDLIMVSEKNEFSSVPMSAEDINEESVRRIISKNDHPNPIYWMLYIVIMLILIYYIYVAMVKECVDGKWYSTSGDVVVIKHNKWNDDLFIEMNGGLLHGSMVGNAIYLKQDDGIALGVFNDKKIYWVGSDDIWTQPGYIL